MNLKKLIVPFLIIFNLFLSAWWLFDGNLLFHTDIARDFYLLHDIWVNKHLTLIGARAGGLTGWFHGPLWLYLNLPAFIIGRSNPLVVGWFWFLLHLLTCAIVYFVAKKIFNLRVALYSLLIYSAVTILDVHSYLNPQGALIVFPLFFYFYLHYKQTASFFSLTLSLFLIGLMIQFEIASAAPILILTFLDCLVSTIKDKKITQFFAYFILIIPLSSYIIFDLRHDFLQLRSLANLAPVASHLNLIDKINAFPLWVFLLGPLFFFIKKKTSAFILFSYFYLGFWLISLFFSGQIMTYYYLPFLPVLIIVAVSLISSLKQPLFLALVFIVCLFNCFNALKDNFKYTNDVIHRDWSTWKSVQTAANQALSDCGPNAGYFVYTADLYGYNLRYALDYQAAQKHLTLHQNIKEPITCLLLGPNVKENPYGSDNWKSGDIKISGDLSGQMTYPNGINIEKYHLSPADQQVGVNPNLIKDAFFR